MIHTHLDIPVDIRRTASGDDLFPERLEIADLQGIVRIVEIVCRVGYTIPSCARDIEQLDERIL